MSTYVTLTINTDMYHEIIDDLMTYCSGLNNYWSMENVVHIIDVLEDEYNESMLKQNKKFEQWLEYEELFNEGVGNTEYEDFQKVNQVLENYKEGGYLDILDEINQFFLILDILNAMEVKS